MERLNPRLLMGGAGLAAACAAICCSVPLLVFVAPGVALLVGGFAEAIEIGVVTAAVLAVLGLVGVLALRRRGCRCAEAARCACGDRVHKPSMPAKIRAPARADIEIIDGAGSVSSSSSHGAS